ncbi:MAG: peptidoglycan DD-metalloendopeptidase family protein [Chloroflexi bacterium AL-N5]|nr:peptidoglycan DD-metalloendopeptidase family protein [Chloroflexi bacterium AL-N5]
MIKHPLRLILFILIGILVILPTIHVQATPQVEESVQAFLDEQPGPLKSYQDDPYTGAEWIQGVSSYYGISPRILLALLEATNGLLSTPNVDDATLRQPFSPNGPNGFGAQIDWAGRELRAGLGSYDRAPTVQFADGTTDTIDVQQSPEGVAIQRFLAEGRTQAEWHDTVERFVEAFEDYFDNQLPDERIHQPAATEGFLQRPWDVGVEVVHLAHFDHMYPTVDTGEPDNGFVVNYLGQGGMQYDGHDGNDYYFPDLPIGTPIRAAADGVAYARTHRGNGVLIIHPNGYETVYWHLDQFSTIFEGKVDTDQSVQVRAGDIIGTSGDTGFVVGTPHLHFEVRHNGRQVDPYGWYGPGVDPCGAYEGCEPSVWLWHSSLVGEFNFTPPHVAPPDTTPPSATMTINPQDDVLFLARFDETPLQDIGIGTPTTIGEPIYEEAQFGTGVRVTRDTSLTYPVEGNMNLDAGTIAFWATLPETYPSSSSNRHYLFTASAAPFADPVYTGTLSLRRDFLGPDNTPQWNFWTTPTSGEQDRNDLTTPDTLEAGLHHFAVTWDREEQSKALYINGDLAAQVDNIELPDHVGETLELGHFVSGYGTSNAIIDDFVIFERALTSTEIDAFVRSETPLDANQSRTTSSVLEIDVNAMDDAGGIMRVQFGIDGTFEDPQPYYDSYPLELPSATGTYSVAARFFDRSDNAITISSTVELTEAPQPQVTLEQVTETGATIVFSAISEAERIEVQIGATPAFANAPWRPITEPIPWRWSPDKPRVLWIRFRNADEFVSGLQILGPDAEHHYLPLIVRH